MDSRLGATTDDDVCAPGADHFQAVRDRLGT